MRHSSGIVLLTLVIALVGSTSARAGVIAELGVPEIDDLQIVAFELERRTQVDIEALARGDEREWRELLDRHGRPFPKTRSPFGTERSTRMRGIGSR